MGFKWREFIFISNRGTHTKINYFHEINDSITKNIDIEQYDIYSININSDEVMRHTNTDYSESYPHYSNDDRILAYISDKNGINNIYLKEDSYAKPCLLLIF